MAVHYCYAASKLYNSVPCLSDSLSLSELKDAIAAPLVAALHGRRMKETFDFKVYDSDTKTEILGANSRIRKHASVIVKRVPHFLLKTTNVAPIGTQSAAGDVEPISTHSNENSCNGRSPRSEVIDDDFGDEIYSAPPVQKKPSGKNAPSASISTCSEVIDDAEFEDNGYSGTSIIMDEDVKNGSKKRAAACDEVMISNKRRFNEKYQSDLACKKVNVKIEQESGHGKREESGVQSVQEKIPDGWTCLVCNKIMKEPMLIPCCFLSFCGDCIKVALAKRNKCPNCHSCKFGAANLLHNRHLNIVIDAYLKSSGSCASSLTTLESTSKIHSLVC